MATLIEKIEEDLKTSLKAHKAARVSTLRMLMASVKNAAIAARTSAKQSLEDDDVEKVIRSEVKKLNDSLVDFTKAARIDLMEAAQAEVEILKSYLPAEISVEELEAKVMETASRLHKEGVKEFGKIMSAVMKEVKADGNRVSAAVKAALEKLK